MTGHPAHQMRPFRVAASHGAAPGSVRLRVHAQTAHDALLRAGMGLARRTRLRPAQWIVTGLTVPAA